MLFAASMVLALHAGTYRAAMVWAERLYAQNVPLARGSNGMEETLDAFRQVERRFPRSKQAKIAMGRSYMAFGFYRYAADAFWLARPLAASEFREANLRARLSDQLVPKFPGRDCLQVVRIPGDRTHWLAMLSKPSNPQPDLFHWSFASKVVVQPFTALRGRVAVVGKRLPVREDWDPDARIATLAVVRLGRSAGYAALVHRTYSAATVEESNEDVFLLTHRGPVHLGEFKGIDYAQAVPASQNHGFRLKVFARVKVGWPDVYEWRHGAFRFANRENPELYKANLGPYTSGDDYYPTWMTRAALADVFGHFRRAAAFWRRAAKLCRERIRHTDYDSYGSNRANLAEIHMRLKWIRRKQYNHWLLYRPYDGDLFVPPYSLGNATDDARYSSGFVSRADLRSARDTYFLVLGRSGAAQNPSHC